MGLAAYQRCTAYLCGNLYQGAETVIQKISRKSG